MSFTIKTLLVAGATATAAALGLGAANAETVIADEEGTWYVDNDYDADGDYLLRSAAEPACYHVRQFTTDAFGDRVQIRARMCRDAFGRTYIVPGSRHVLREY